MLLQLNLFSGNVYLIAAARSLEAIEALLAKLRELLPAPDPSARHEVTVTFWTYGPHGPMPSWRSIAVPSWDEIRDNYAVETRGGLDRLMQGWQPAHGGQLVLWHGLGRDREDVWFARARVGVARLVRLPLHRRPRHVLRRSTPTI